MIILEALFFIIPTYIANGMANVVKIFPILSKWSTPIDFGKSYKGNRILGDGKTFRGFVGGVFFAVLSAFLQYLFAKNHEFKYLTFFNDPNLVKTLILGGLLGFGALFGDVVKSFIKRRIGIKRGRPWPPFDQLDFIVGGFLFAALITFPGWNIFLVLIIVTPVIHLISNVIAYLFKIKDVWW